MQPRPARRACASAPRRARRPFHPGRLGELLRRYWLVQQVEALGEEEEGAGEKAPEQLNGAREALAGQDEGDSGAGLAIVAEAVPAAEVAARQAALKERFGQVRQDAGRGRDWRSWLQGAGMPSQAAGCCLGGSIPQRSALPPGSGCCAHPHPRPPPPQVLRSKGFLWLAGRDDVSGDWSQAGSVLRVRCGGGPSSQGGARAL